MLSEATNLIAENCILLFYQMGAEDPFSWTLSAPVKEMMKLFSLKPSFATEIHWVWHQSDFRVFNRPHHLVSLKNLCCGKGDEVIVIWFFCIKKKKKKKLWPLVLQGVEPWSENINTTKSIYCRNCFALWNYDEPQTFICLTSPVYISLISMKLTRLRNGHICSVLTIHVWYGDLCLSCWLGVRWGKEWGQGWNLWEKSTVAMVWFPLFHSFNFISSHGTLPLAGRSWCACAALGCVIETHTAHRCAH